ncbi:hypothetical protein [Micromonospora sp. SL4-19]|uniref:hypothetical protein n=1 Tax=Micromonospora sp. SL4-19 TaxID=3399129 RepID=UPI003A4D909C
MSQDLPIPRQDDRSDGTTVVEWGADESAPPGRVGRSLAGLGRDPRLPLVLAGLGAVAAVASLAGEWLVMHIPNGEGGPASTIRLPSGVGDVGGFGVGYLIGLLGLSSAVALALRGTGAIRQNVRVAGLGLAAAVLAMLTGAAFALDDSGQRTFFYAQQEEGFRAEYGRGLVTAFVSTVLFAAALYLSGRVVAEAPDRKDEPGDGALPADRGRPERGRRRATGDELPVPADLTVQPTTPFARPELPH